MKLFYATNFWSLHQAPIAAALAERLGAGEFAFGLFRTPDAERLRMGWSARGARAPWVLGPPANAEERLALRRVALEADVAVLGDVPMDVRLARARTGRPTFLMTERLWKSPLRAWRFLNPFFLRWLRRHREVGRRPNCHCLTIGAFAAEDERRIGAFADRCWRWGYFCAAPPSLPPRDATRPATLLWAGRMIELKRVDVLLRAAAQIRNDPSFGGLRLLGDGPQRPALEELARRLQLDRTVTFVGNVPPQQVWTEMAAADIFVFPSDRREGWGMVLNEAMAQGCVAVAGTDAGAARELVRHGENGFLFPCADAATLAVLLRRIMADPAVRAAAGQAAWQSMRTLWGPAAAADRLLALCESVLRRGPMPAFRDGPGSPATSAKVLSEK